MGQWFWTTRRCSCCRFRIGCRAGRHGDFFKGNVVAIGNSYAFVEPLESTALHMVIYELEYLTNHLPLKSDRASKQQLSLKMNSLWDQLRTAVDGLRQRGCQRRCQCSLNDSPDGRGQCCCGNFTARQPAKRT